MHFRYTIGGLLLATAVIAVLAGLSRIGGFALAVFAFLSYGGIGLLIGSAWGTTVEVRFLMVFVGVGMIAAAMIWLLTPTIH
jgi:hypothetical protein